MPETLYKLTDQDGYTRRGDPGETLWEIGVKHTASGDGELCGKGWIHAYTHPLLAVLLNPIHANIISLRLFRCEGEVGKTDNGLKVGCLSLTPVEEIAAPTITTEQRIQFAILCAKEICRDSAWNLWADRWLSGEDRSLKEATTTAARAAAATAEEAEVWAAREAWAASKIDLIAIAIEACRKEAQNS